MNIEKRGSSYRVRMMVDGKTYSFTLPYKPSEAQALMIITEKIQNSSGLKGTFKYYANNYIEIKEKVLSPKTIREYHNYLRVFPEWFMKKQIDDIKSHDVQKLINELYVGRSPKTMRNYHGLVSAVMNMYRPVFTFKTTLPQKLKTDDYIPSKFDLQAVLKEAEDTEYYIFLKLACMGLRRGEICALTLDDLDDKNILHINKALVLDKENNWVVKSTKTLASTRDVPIPESLADEIRKQGYIFRQTPNSVIKWLNKTQAKLGLPRFSLHKIRHYFASELLDMGVPTTTIESLGGWENSSSVLRNVYQHNMKKENEKREILSKLTNGIF